MYGKRNDNKEQFIKIVRKFGERDELYGARKCINCKCAESGVDLEVSCTYDYNKSKDYI